MYLSRTACFFIVFGTLVVAGRESFGQPYSINWHTIDGGGATFSTGGSYALGGTIGQYDAGSIVSPMSGGTFEVVGGFWAFSLAGCNCPGDLNADGIMDGRDVSQFTACMIAGGSCACADVDGSPGLTSNDVSVFVANLLTGDLCS